MKVRRKHTAYLTEELVRALDRSYYERRTHGAHLEAGLLRGAALAGTSPARVVPLLRAGDYRWTGGSAALAADAARARSCEAAAPDACLLSGAPARDRPGPSARTGGTRPPQPHPERRRPRLIRQSTFKVIDHEYVHAYDSSTRRAVNFRAQTSDSAGFFRSKWLASACLLRSVCSLSDCELATVRRVQLCDQVVAREGLRAQVLLGRLQLRFFAQTELYDSSG